jgi:integrase
MALESNNSLAVRPAAAAVKLTKAAQRVASNQACAPVPHWGMAEVVALVDAARRRGRGQKGERDALLIQTIFDGALRVSEALGLHPADVIRTEGGYRLQVDGKTGPRQVAISPSLVARLQSYAYETGLHRDARFFPINRHRVWQIVDAAADLAGLVKPLGVGMVQDQLGHASPAMTMRYWRTLNREEALKIQEMVDFIW